MFPGNLIPGSSNKRRIDEVIDSPKQSAINAFSQVFSMNNTNTKCSPRLAPARTNTLEMVEPRTSFPPPGSSPDPKPKCANCDGDHVASCRGCSEHKRLKQLIKSRKIAGSPVHATQSKPQYNTPKPFQSAPAPNLNAWDSPLPKTSPDIRQDVLPPMNNLSTVLMDIINPIISRITSAIIKAIKEALGSLHVWDASGRYSSQFFFGNDFWLGSKRLCSLVKAPFPLVFYQVKLSLNIGKELTPTGREISLGVCLPQTCSAPDVKALLSAASAHPSNVVRILRVRPVPGPYSLFSDPKMHILMTVIAVLVCMMTVGTAYEAILERRTKQVKQRRSNNNEGKVSLKEDLTKSEEEMVSVMDPCRGMGQLGELFLSFSILSNGRKILDCGAPAKDSLTCVHGLRFLSLAWVIMVHTYLQIFAIAENKKLRRLTEKNFMFQTVSNATFSVDSFFFISGLLVAYLYFKSASKGPRGGDGESVTLRREPKPLSVELKGVAIKFFTLLGYRFIRLTPAYLFVLGIVELNMKWLKNNSVFEPISLDNVNCDKYWWRNMLYINSLYPRSEMCMLWSWYLSNDTQFYVLGILLLLISSRFFKLAVSGLFLILISSCVTCALISLQYSLVVRVDDPFILFDQLYDKPWTRVGPYIMGLFAGWFLHKTKCSLRMSKCVSLTGWAVSLSILFGLVYGVLDTNMGVTTSAVYVSIGHTAWGVGLAWIVIACCSGYGGCINSLLSCRLLQPLSRLTYCAYLIHPVIMVITSFQMEGPLHLHNLMVFILYFGNIVASFLASFVISLMLEAPVVRLLKVILTPVMKTTD